jgi:osmoprotectant transport system ATP-binding protein
MHPAPQLVSPIMPPVAVEFRAVGKDFLDPTGRLVPAVLSVDLAVRTGETLCIIGTSGSGKTTLLKMVNRLVEPTRGTVQVGGLGVADQDPIALRRSIGYVIQSGGLFPHMTVERNIGLLADLEGWDPERRRTRVHELLALVHLPPSDFLERMPDELSGGQRQRVGVARALVLDPPVVLMDEPFGALDPITRITLRDEFVDLKSAVGKTVVFVTHDMAEAFALGDRVALMDAGRLVQVGIEADFRQRPAEPFVTEFLGRHFA